jgi:cytoskeleton protein RodZ
VIFSGVTWLLVPSSQPDKTQPQIAATEETDPMPTASTAAEDATIIVNETAMDGNDLATAEPSEPAVTAPAPELTEDVLGAFIKDNVAGTTEAPAQMASALPEGRVFGSPDTKVRLVLKANRNIWLLIEDNRGNRVATQLLNKGDLFRVPNAQGLAATVQDGGAITYIIDGIEKGILGQPGSVLAAESLDIKKLEAKS